MAIHDRHHDVHQDEIGALLLQHVECHLPICGLEDRVSHALDHRA